MPNYVLSRTSPVEHRYERKLNLGYGVKVDTSDAEPNKGKQMNEQALEVAHEQPAVAAQPAPVNGQHVVDDRVQPARIPAVGEAPQGTQGKDGNQN